MSWIMVDVETDGPCPGLYSMVCFGAVVVRGDLSETFYGRTAPLCEAGWQPETLAVSGITKEEHNRFPHPIDEMKRFDEWVRSKSVGRPMLVSDNNGFDAQFVNYYFWRFLDRNPFGHSSTNLGSLYKGMVKDTRKNFKFLRKTVHDHNPVNDAKGNAEALMEMQKMGLNIQLD